MEEVENKIEKFKKQGVEIKKEVKERTLTYIIAAFALVAGLAWNEAIGSLIEHLFALGKDTLIAKFIYAVLITLVVVVVTIYLERVFRKKKKSTN